jgi:4-carboxymuconolactone decarboxylase
MKALQNIIIFVALFSHSLLNAQSMSDTVKKQTAGHDILGEFAPKFAELNDDVLFGEVWSREQELSAKNRSMITVAALISGGNFEQLPNHLKKAKENGITKTEIAEIITHLAFYAGWPKAWSAFSIAKEIYNDGNDLSAKIETSPASYVRLAKIRVDATKLDSYIAALKEEVETSLRVESGVLKLYAVSDKNNPEHITITEIYANEEAYRTHIKTPHFLKYKHAVNDMVKSLELVDVVPLVPDTKTKTATGQNEASIFPQGELITNSHFTGKTWLHMLAVPEAPHNIAVGNVTFSPAARNSWHSHRIGQLLLVTSGKGWYQEHGKPARPLQKGDVVNIPAGTKHWHGAAANSWFVHIAVTSGESDWFEAVTDETYNKLVKEDKQ